MFTSETVTDKWWLEIFNSIFLHIYLNVLGDFRYFHSPRQICRRIFLPFRSVWSSGGKCLHFSTPSSVKSVLDAVESVAVTATRPSHRLDSLSKTATVNIVIRRIVRSCTPKRFAVRALNGMWPILRPTMCNAPHKTHNAPQLTYTRTRRLHCILSYSWYKYFASHPFAVYSLSALCVHILCDRITVRVRDNRVFNPRKTQPNEKEQKLCITLCIFSLMPTLKPPTDMTVNRHKCTHTHEIKWNKLKG